MSRFITVTVLGGSGYIQSGERTLLNCDHITFIKKFYNGNYVIYTNAPIAHGDGQYFYVSPQDAQRIFNIIGASL